jgi:hypothetical protein
LGEEGKKRGREGERKGRREEGKERGREGERPSKEGGEEVSKLWKMIWERGERGSRVG